MKKLKSLYQRISKQTQNRIQELIDTFNFNNDNLYDTASVKDKTRINNYIEEWKDKDLLKGYFGMLANNIYRRSRVKNNELLELLIYSAYIEEQTKLEQHELELFKDDVEYYYNEGINEVRETEGKKKKWSAIPNVLFLYLLAETNALGYTWQKQAEQMALNNANEIYRQATISLMQQKPLKMDSDAFKMAFQNQLKQKVNINGDKISGAVDLQLIGMNNRAKIKGIETEDSKAKVVFLAVMDGKETEMCGSLNLQEFYINKENEFDRYYGETQKELRIERVKCKGLVVGLNLPPISHHFHWCRSTITYQNRNYKNIELVALYNYVRSFGKQINVEIPDNLDKFAQMRYNKKGYIDDIINKKEAYDIYKDQVLIGGGEKEVKFQDFYNIYKQRNELKDIVTSDGIKVGKVQPHSLYRLANRKIEPIEIRRTLENGIPEIDLEHNSILYTSDEHIYVVIANDVNHNIKTIMKRRKRK